MRFVVFDQVGRTKVKAAREKASSILTNRLDPIEENREVKQEGRSGPQNLDSVAVVRLLLSRK